MLMGQIDLDFGDSITGLLVDCENDSFYVGATLRLTHDEGVVVEVPYVLDGEVQNFARVRKWFENREIPSALVLLTTNGAIGLYENRWRSYNEAFGYSVASIGRFCPSYSVLGVTLRGSLESLAVGEIASWFDGLNVWSPVSALSENPIMDERGCAESLEIKTGSNQIATWSQGGARMELRTTWEGRSTQDGYKQRIFVDGNVSLVSKFESGAKAAADHLYEHQKFKDFMTFIFGRQLSFRRHCLRDENVSARFVSGSDVTHISSVEFVSADTVREKVEPIPDMKGLRYPIASLGEIGVEGLERWANLYDEWERFILPSANVLGRKGGIVEDSIISTCMSIEAAASKLESVEGEECVGARRGQCNVPIAVCVYRCLTVLDVRWPDQIESVEGLSRAIAAVYNSIKHASRGSFPDGVRVRVVSKINEMIVRLLAVYVAGAGDAVFPRYRQSMELLSIAQILSAYDCRIRDDGSWDIGVI